MHNLRIIYQKIQKLTHKRIKFFLNNANISGIRFLSDRTDTFGKIFWCIILLISFCGMLIIFQLTSERFFSDYVSIGIETTYLNWNNTFPAISICLVKGRMYKLLTPFIQSANLTYHNNEQQFIRNIYYYMFANSNQMAMSTDECQGLNSTCGVNLTILNEMFLPKSCQNLFTKVYFAGQLYENCEEIFHLHKTEIGVCFVANSIKNYDFDVNNLPLKFNRDSKDHKLKIYYRLNTFYSYQLFIHSPEDFPYFNMLSFMLSKEPMQISVDVEEIINDDGIQNQPFDYRRCRFPYEKLPNSTHHYSFSTCMSDLRIFVELQNCNCTLPTSPIKYMSQYCTPEGITCLSAAKINMQTKQYHSDPNRNCLQSCIEQKITIVGENEKRVEKLTGFNYIEIDVINLPTVRYIRQVAKTSLDLVVTIGGVAGLFFGASIVNIAEIIYICFIRKF